MTIIAEYANVTVEILDGWQNPDGVSFASVKAVEGQPFVGGLCEPVRSAYRVVKAAELQNVHSDPQPAPAAPNLLAMALEYADKSQWSSGETVWIYKRQVFLKEQQGFVHLCVVGKQASCKVFWLNADGWHWEPVHSVNTRYSQWVEKVAGGK